MMACKTSHQVLASAYSRDKIIVTKQENSLQRRDDLVNEDIFQSGESTFESLSILFRPYAVKPWLQLAGLFMFTLNLLTVLEVDYQITSDALHFRRNHQQLFPRVMVSI